MENRAYALIVGVFVIVLGLAGAACFWWFSGASQESVNYVIVSHRAVTGLNPQAAVRFRGVRVGKVLDIGLEDSREVQILVSVEAGVPVTRGTFARIGIAGLTGQGFIQLDDDGSSAAPPERGEDGLGIIAMAASGGSSIESMGEGAQALLARLQRSSDRVERLLSDQNLSHISQTLEHMSRSAANLDRTLETSASLAQDMRRFSTPENAARLTSTLESLRGASAQLGPALDDFRRTLARLDGAGVRIERLGADVQTALNGETLPRANQMLLDLQTSTQQLNRVLDDIERDPQLLILGRQRTAPGPGEVHP